MFILPQIWPAGAPSSWLLCPFSVTPPFFQHLLTGAKKNTFQTHLKFSMPCPEIGQFSF